MAKFAPAFANDGERRGPTPGEVAQGFPCGPADQTLFNFLFYQLQSELGDLITYAGLTPSDSTNTQVREAVLALIEAATGGGDPSGYVTMLQARARLPIFPEILTSDGRIVVTVPSAGNIRLPGGVNFNHRGIFQVTTVQTDWATVASKTYHLRWNPTDGFVLKDLANLVYNPSSFPETHVSFDSTYDDMLIARIITNASNVATITNLMNKDRILVSGESASLPVGGIETGFEDNTPPSGLVGTYGQIIDVNLARRPVASVTGFTDVTVQSGTQSEVREMNIVVQSPHRYSIKAIYQRTLSSGGGWIGYQLIA